MSIKYVASQAKARIITMTIIKRAIFPRFIIYPWSRRLASMTFPVEIWSY